MEHKITLIFGHTDKKGDVHKEVTFGRRPTAGDMILLDTDPQARSATQYTDLISRRAITAFGSLKVPVGLDVTLGLNSIDRADLQAGLDKFLELGREDRIGEYRDANTVKLRFGFNIDGTEYTVVEMNRITTGRDEADADVLGISNPRGIAYNCFMIGRRITRLTTDDGAAAIEGPIGLDKFKDLDGEDLNLLRIGAQLADASFRVLGDGVSRKLASVGGDSPVEARGADGERDPRVAGAKDRDVRSCSAKDVER
jgi:phage FluMu protein gp41